MRHGRKPRGDASQDGIGEAIGEVEQPAVEPTDVLTLPERDEPVDDDYSEPFEDASEVLIRVSTEDLEGDEDLVGDVGEWVYDPAELKIIDEPEPEEEPVAAAAAAAAEPEPEPVAPAAEPEATEIEPKLEPEAVALATEPAATEPAATEPEPEPVAIEPELEAEPEPVAIEPELEAEPQPEPVTLATEPEPVAIEPEPEAAALATESVAIEPEPEPAATAAEPEAAALATEPVATAAEPEAAEIEPKLEPEAVALATAPELEPEILTLSVVPEPETVALTVMPVAASVVEPGPAPEPGSAAEPEPEVEALTFDFESNDSGEEFAESVEDGEPDEATRTEQHEDGSLQLRLARVHLKTGALLMARAELEALGCRDRLDMLGRLSLAEARWRTGDLHGAGEAATAYLAVGGDEALGYLIAAEAAAAASHPVESRRLVEAALKRKLDKLDCVFAGVRPKATWDPALWIDDGHDADSSLAVSQPALMVDGTQPVSPVEAPPAPPAPDVSGSPPTADEEALVEVGSGQACLEGGDPMVAALHFSVALRMAPSSAPAVLKAIGIRTDLPLQIARGDALRLLGLEGDAGKAYLSVASALGSARAQMDGSSASEAGPAKVSQEKSDQA